MLKIDPMRDLIVVRPDHDTGERRDGALVVVELTTPPAWRGTVEAVGPEVRDLRAGMRVVFSRLQGVEVAGNRILLPESAVLAYEVEPEEVGA